MIAGNSFQSAAVCDARESSCSSVLDVDGSFETILTATG
jgi:hypothetical protein